MDFNFVILAFPQYLIHFKDEGERKKFVQIFRETSGQKTTVFN